MEELTPMMRQYMEAKKEHPDALLFFRLGDFYEMFYDDAKIAAKELELTLTSRSSDKGKNPMCGVPYRAVDSYVERLVSKGYKVAIAEQIGDPKAKGLTQRKIIRVVTPGTLLSGKALEGSRNNYIALLYEEKEEVTLVIADVSTGEMRFGSFRAKENAEQDDSKSGKDHIEAVLEELYIWMPAELLTIGNLSFLKKLEEFLALRLPHCTRTQREATLTDSPIVFLARYFAVHSLPPTACARDAVAYLLLYLQETVKTKLAQINCLRPLRARGVLAMDAYTLKNLEVTRNLRDGGRKGTLLAILDFTQTPMGGRLLRQWLEHPLLSTSLINQRLDGVEDLVQHFTLRAQVKEALKPIYDFERLLTRIEVGNANARDLLALKQSLLALPALKKILQMAKAHLLHNAGAFMEIYPDLAELLTRAIAEDPALTVHEGGIIKKGYNPELDEYRNIAHDSKRFLQELEEREREKTGIRALKIGYNKVFGYYIEVRHTSVNSVPAHYVRKQTLANAERYITEELKAFETKILGAEEKAAQLEYALFTEVCTRIQKALPRIQSTSIGVARVDVLYSLAEAASAYNYMRPTLATDGAITMEDSRHPLVERILTQGRFVPNDARLNHEDAEILLLTGPNMAGKSTYMRQVALICLLAQAGSFVPARKAHITPVDRIFTRIGASDDLAGGQSTFMMEMNEVAHILKHATRDSLVVLDEIGRGTSTFDGMSIARAVIEYIRDKIHAKTLFATHYHELTDMADERVKNFRVAVKERGEDVVFLRRIVPGGADKSYGIHVAKLAGLPEVVIERAKGILESIECGDRQAIRMEKITGDEAEVEMKTSLPAKLEAELLSLDVMSMTPIEALDFLFRLQKAMQNQNTKEPVEEGET